MQEPRRKYVYSVLNDYHYSGSFFQVHLVISGDDDETGTRTLEDPHRKVLQRGGIDSFIMAVPK